MNPVAVGAPRGAATDQAARSVWVLIAFLAVSVVVLGVASRALGPVSLEGHAVGEQAAWELPMSVRSTIWYIEVLLISAAGWLVWAYPQPGLRRRATALVGVNLMLAAVVRPALLALVPEHGGWALWLVVVAVALLAGVLALAAVALRRTHRVSAMLIVPCIVWAVYVVAVTLARSLGA